ncbi:MAG: hypothetical protein C4B59_10665 [Candidatus Methanogaster sp.]|uniref:Uncharacterized protein n=1 Tax=Candidatus Methanogaster sp. TaxID=3386292 RepID=A0AC61L1G2_9EURY|nr:MAG: hypothetical protein C4B59_10665 [ANME-2 cluster archaeon]
MGGVDFDRLFFGRHLVFVEGKTEMDLLKIMGCPEKIIMDCGGKTNMPTEIKVLMPPCMDNDPRMLILRDKDGGENNVSIIQSFEHHINNLLKESETPRQTFQQHRDFENLYTMDVPDANFRAALHIAAPPSIEDLYGKQFVSETIDGYILALAMNGNVLKEFAKRAKITSNDINPEDALRWAVCKGVPGVADKAEITFDQTKDYLGVYMAMSKFLTVKRSENEDVFSGIVINMAKKHARDKFQETFRSVSTALKFIEIGPKMEDRDESTEKRLESRLSLSDRP